MPRDKKTLLLYLMVGVLVFASGCGTTRSHFTYDSSFQVNTPKTRQGCYDAAVVLGVNMAKAKEIVKKVLAVNTAQIKEDSETHIRAWTPVETFRGGGDELNVNLEKVDDNHTFITVATLSLAGSMAKGWSCEVINEMVVRAEE